MPRRFTFYRAFAPKVSRQVLSQSFEPGFEPRFRAGNAKRLLSPAAKRYLCNWQHRGFVRLPSGTDDGRLVTMPAKTSFRGSFTALVPPFKNGSVDEKAFRTLVDWQI